MKGWLKSLYERTPIPAKRLLIHGYGRYLHLLREGRPMARAIDVLESVDRADPERRATYQLERLNDILSWADARIPAWRGRALVGSGPGGRLRSLDELERLPTLTKLELRPHAASYVAAGIRKHYGHTSGTTGTPLQLWYDRDQLVWNRAAEKIVRSRAGIASDERVAVIYGLPVIPKSRRRPPYWVVNDADRELLLSAFHIGRATATAYLDAIREFGAVALEAYPHVAYVLARLSMETGGTLRLRRVITSSETLLPFQRETIEEAFGAEVFDFYAAAERVAFAVECSRHAGLHLLEGYGIVEAGDSDPASPRHLVGTGLTNRVMPFIRYRMDDVIRMIDEPCGCGLTSRRLAPITTKSEDLIVTPDGRFISPATLTHPFKPIVGVLRSQIVQERLETLVVRVEATPEFDAVQEATLHREIAARMGPEVEVRIVHEPVMEPERSGKFRWIISRIEGARRLAEVGHGETGE
jgi:phenylacetate-CoA ligase